LAISRLILPATDAMRRKPTVLRDAFCTAKPQLGVLGHLHRSSGTPGLRQCVEPFVERSGFI
jgi:hypothetical protein